MHFYQMLFCQFNLSSFFAQSGANTRKEEQKTVTLRCSTKHWIIHDKGKREQ